MSVTVAFVCGSRSIKERAFAPHGRAFPPRHRSGRFANSALEIDKAQDVSFLALEALDPSLDSFAFQTGPL